MKPTFFAVLAALALPLSSAQTARPDCYTSTGDMEMVGTSVYQSTGICMNMCNQVNAYYYATQGKACWCGKQPPPFETKTDNRACTIQCPGYPFDKCGGDGVYSVGEMPGDHPSISSGESASTMATASTAVGTLQSTATADNLAMPSKSSGPTSSSSASVVPWTSSTPLASAVHANSTSGASPRFKLLFLQDA
ncbi:uncharacterized protein BO66DRAFT_388484 [Aspergillus aculeatinus CBS 121060]|uniref:Uncharacterized protein n=1 Tax=Aspergillus aculeatinus CBS 121060 TaxID=1448322 RepID=A0ACD1HK12_9EURO|nr:hypothetical protein BO66DRAFT_388484 [Aspergillus aculeatinus CBS 121060]RAH73802.1 hypothetical protein BO66DRAFT_388484 [Aspergillus aculeatinus CBS 121060]